MKKKDDFHLGLEKLLNDKNVSPLTNPAGYKQLLLATNQPMSHTFKHLGKGEKNQKKEDEERAKSRLNKLQEDDK